MHVVDLSVLLFIQSSQRPLQARKALRLADRSYLEGDYTPSADRHGTPRRTVVLVLASAVHVLLDHGCASLGTACADLATQVRPYLVLL